MNEMNLKIPLYKFINHGYQTKDLLIKFNLKSYLSEYTLEESSNNFPYVKYNPNNIYDDLEFIEDDAIINFNILNYNFIYIYYYVPIDISYKIVKNPFIFSEKNYYFNIDLDYSFYRNQAKTQYPILTDITELINFDPSNSVFNKLDYDKKFKILNKFTYLLSKKNRIFLLTNFIAKNTGNDIGFVDMNSIILDNYQFYQNPATIIDISNNYLNMIKEIKQIYNSFDLENKYNYDLKINAKFITDRIREFYRMIELKNIHGYNIYKLLYVLPSLLEHYRQMNINSIDDLNQYVLGLWNILNNLNMQNMCYIRPNQTLTPIHIYMLYQTLPENYYENYNDTDNVYNPLEELIDFSNIQKQTFFIENGSFKDISGKTINTPYYLQILKNKENQ